MGDTGLKESIRCSHCGSEDVRPSHKNSGRNEYTVYRCRACKRHFKVGAGRSPVRLVVGLALLFLAGGAVVGFFASSPSAVDYQPRVDTQDAQALAKVRGLASKGDAQAQYDLGWTIWQQDNFTEALPWLKAAADRGHAEAQYLLGQAYQYGRGTVQDFRAAQAQFTKAAEQGHPDAEYQLGLFHRDGLAAPPNKETAYVWLNLAAAQGHAEALVFRDKLTLSMTGQEILRAQEASAHALKMVQSRSAQVSHP